MTGPALTAALIVLALSVARATQDTIDPAQAVRKAWVLLDSALESGNLPERFAALRAVAAHDSSRAPALIERTVRDRSNPLRSSALELLPSDTAVPLLAEALQDSDVQVRRAAVQQLSRYKDSRALSLLQAVLMTGDADMAGYAEGSARLLGSDAFGLLLQAVDTGGEPSREAAARCVNVLVDGWLTQQSAQNLDALRLLRPERILTRALGDSNANVRAFAALTLARLGNAAAVDELTRMVAAPDPKFGTILSRHYAMAALNMFGRPGYLAPLAAALANQEQRVRLDAAYAMRSFVHPSMRDALDATWRSGSFPEVRYWAFYSLVALAPDDVALLRAGLNDSESSIRLRAAERILARGPDPAAVGVLEQLVADLSTRNLSLNLLMTKGDPRRTAALARSLLPKSSDDLAHMRGQSYDPEYRLSAVYVLENLRDRDAVPAFAMLLDLGTDPTLSDRIVRALVAINDDPSRRTLVRALDSPHSAVRIAAAGGVLSVYTSVP